MEKKNEFKFNNKKSIPSLAKKELNALMREFKLTPSRHTEISELHGGIMNKVYLLSTNKEKFVIRKLNNNIDRKNKPDQQKFIRFLRKNNVPAPEYLTNTSDEEILFYNNYCFEIYKYTKGRRYNLGNNKHFDSLIDLVNKLHNVAKKFECKNNNANLAKIIEKSFLVLYQKYNQWIKWLPYDNSEPLMYIYEFLRSEDLKKLDKTKLITQWIHGDLSPANIIFNKHGKAQSIIDFDRSGPNFRGIDLIILIMNSCLLPRKYIDVGDDSTYLTACQLDNQKMQTILEKYILETNKFGQKEALAFIVYGRYYILKRNLWRIIQSIQFKKNIKKKELDRYWINTKQLLKSFNCISDSIHDVLI